MLFNSLTFVVFFAVVVTLYWSIRSWNARKNLLVTASYIFYGAWNPPFAALLFSTTAMDFWLGRQNRQSEKPISHRAWLVASVCMNLSMLGFFKYGNFLLENFQWLLAHIGIIYHPPHLDILLPVGISFYTFHSLSYTLDIYRGVLQPTRSLRDFVLAVSFFPQLVAGPIVRAGDFLPQLVDRRVCAIGQFMWGLLLMTLGLFEKIVLADTMLAGSADRIFGYAGPLVALDSWLGVIAFAGQIFFDFAGYSICAIGAALCLGFHLKDNFRFPYAAIGFSDFWRRWHISLSTFLRDYLYIPLGGNRVSWTAPRSISSSSCSWAVSGMARPGRLWFGDYCMASISSSNMRRAPSFGNKAWTDSFAVESSARSSSLMARSVLPGYFSEHPISPSPRACCAECSAATRMAMPFSPRAKCYRSESSLSS